ncbi:MAG TPA: PAS domain S-box protein [Nitrospirota bacterium]
MDPEHDQYYQDLINAVSEPLLLIDSGRTVRMVNDAFLAMQGAASEDVIGKPCFAVLHRREAPCQLPFGECPHIGVFEAGKSAVVTHRHFTAQNKELVVELAASPVRDKDGRVVRMAEVVRDVTEGRRLRAEARQSLDFLASVLEGIGEGVVVVDRQFRILTANKGYLGQVGKNWQDVIGMTCYEVSHHFTSPCRDTGHDCPVKIVFETASEARAIHTHYDEGGEKIYVECHAYPIQDDSGRVVRAIETIRDVTEQVRLEQKLKESEEKYRDLYDHAPDGYYSIAGNGLIVEVNHTFLNMLGYRREEVVGKIFIDDLLLKESVGTCHARFPELKKTGRMTDVEITMKKKDGSPLPVVVSATAVYDAGGTFVMSRSMIRDITERKKADEERRKLEEQLFQSQKLEALGTLAGGIAHDFNNLLASILGYASLAKADLTSGDPVYQHVDIIESASLRASELTQQLLAFAKGGKYDPKPNDMNAVVRDAASLLSSTVGKNIAVSVQEGEGLRPALCDAGQVQQAILNICINGRDAMPKGGTLTLKAENVSLSIDDVQFFVDVPPGDYVRISVSDTGLGMDRETRKHIFEPFFTTKKEGTGLGLSLAYSIVRKNNGFIQVYSEPGRGSRFQVNLPACMTEELCAKKREIIDLRRGSETILVVDDEPAITDLARQILRRYGYSVLTAGEGREAVELYQQRRGEIAAVLLDMVMPGMDGRDVFARLRAINPYVKVIASSGYGQDRDADDLLKQGAAGFVQKPYRIAELVRVVGDVVENKSRVQGPAVSDQ